MLADELKTALAKQIVLEFRTAYLQNIGDVFKYSGEKVKKWLLIDEEAGTNLSKLNSSRYVTFASKKDASNAAFSRAF